MTDEEVWKQWLRDGMVPLEYVERVTRGSFSTAQPLAVTLTDDSRTTNEPG